MSNGPFFNSRSGGSGSLVRQQKQKDLRDMHWTKYLKKYPLSEEPVWDNAEGDRNVRLDMDWDPNITEDKETT